MNSFLRKYASLAGLQVGFLKRLFRFTPAKIGQPLRFMGGNLYFSYTLHTIPCIRFCVHFGNKSLVISGDTLNAPDRIDDMWEKGFLTDARRAELRSFDWDHDVILHEAGVPPIHTPMTTFFDLPDDVKERLHLVHVAAKDIPPGKGLKVAKVGLQHTISADVDEPPDSAFAMRVLHLLGKTDLLEHTQMSSVSFLLQIAKPLHLVEGEAVFEEGDTGRSFFIICEGVANCLVNGNVLKVRFPLL